MTRLGAALVALAVSTALDARAAWLPLASDARWTYSVTGDAPQGPLGAALGALALAVAGPMRVEVRAGAGGATEVVEAWRLAGGVRDADWIASDADTIRVYRARGDEGGRLPVPVLLAEWRRADGADETVAVAAGTFACVRVTATGDAFRSTLWVAPDVGIVRHEIAWTSPAGVARQRWELARRDQSR